MRLLTLALATAVLSAQAAADDAGFVGAKVGAPPLRLAQADPSRDRKPAVPVNRPPVPPPAKPLSPRETYAAMTLADRTAIQADLMWAGYYDSIVDGEFGERSIAAVREFQKRANARQTGILNPAERAQLAGLAQTRQAQVGWRMVNDSVTGVRLGLPAKLVSQASRGKSGSRWASTSGDLQIETFRINDLDTTLAGVAAKQRGETDRKIDYDVQRPEFFVLSGDQGNKKFYVRAHARGEDVRGFMVLYDPARQAQMQTIVVVLSNAFVPFRADAAGDARRKVEYSTGIVVSGAGDVLASRDATDDCHVIRIAGLAPAERTAEDAGSGLALLRLHGARNLHAVPLTGAATAAGGAVTLVGVADPRTQDGRNAVTTRSARIADGRKLDAAPAEGFSGAAALDQDGRLRGIVVPNRQSGESEVLLVPTGAVARFLQANEVTPYAGASALKDIRAAAVRVICVRL